MKTPTYLYHFKKILKISKVYIVYIYSDPPDASVTGSTSDDSVMCKIVPPVKKGTLLFYILIALVTRCDLKKILPHTEIQSLKKELSLEQSKSIIIISQ